MNEPDVSVPAFMRNYHEVLRNDLARVLAPLADAGDVAGFAVAWEDYTRAIAVHAAMEDGVEGTGGGLVAMLDRFFDGAAGVARFRSEHQRDHIMQSAVADAVAAGSTSIRDVFGDYRAAAEAHLKHEEDVMMPLVARLPQPKAALFASWCLAAGAAHTDFDRHVTHGVESLAAHGSTRNTPAGATRVYLHSLKSVCTPAQWSRCLQLARDAAPPGIWAAVLAEVPNLESMAATAA